ncbi:hypothetical protein B9W68_05630 [Streptomyces sp. CS227]|uniref:terpene synthase family protein n=1 Tax=Streptomyces sp. CS227 TaxID=1982763 RepID=UPI000B7673F1|nr:hypothetical protein [Streptomyces sp. CS227]OWA18394.1 hypothetical protein B9W68_05630 [Streptomyces sp. CS227]
MIEPLDAVQLPPFYCPLESHIHPRVRLVEQRALQWLRTCGMCATDAEYRRAAGSRSVDFYGRFVPSAGDEHLLATALWVYWGFAFDDARCDDGPLSTRPSEFNALAGRVQRALEAPSARDPAERYVAPLQDIANRFRSLGTPTQFSRFAAAHRAWLSGVSWQIGSRSLGRMPSLDEYLAMRLLSSGGEPTFAMVELALGMEVPAAEMHRPAVRALTEMAIMVAALDNDRHSLHREIGEGQDINVYNVLTHGTGLSVREAVTAAAGLRDRVLTRFLVLSEQVNARAGVELRAYLRGLGHGIRGNIEWASRVPRYHAGEAGPAKDDSTLPVCVDAPADATKGPVPAPSVAWWWDDLA